MFKTSSSGQTNICGALPRMPTPRGYGLAYIHANCGPAFLSNELISHLHRRGIACSRTSVYNPCGSGQCERYTAVIRSSVKLTLKLSLGLDISQWKSVLPHALHSIRSFLCTATNETLISDY